MQEMASSSCEVRLQLLALDTPEGGREGGGGEGRRQGGREGGRELTCSGHTWREVRQYSHMSV